MKMEIKYENLKSNKGEFLEGILLIKPKFLKILEVLYGELEFKRI